MGIFSSTNNNNYFSSYIDIKAISAPSSPNSGIGRLFYNTSTGKLSFKKSNGTVVDLESGGGGGTVESASNVGLGSGWFKTLNGTDLEFKSLIAGTNQLSITSNTNDLTLDVVEANIKLDDLGAPDDNTDLNASATKHGLLPKLSGNSTDFLTGQGTWAVPAGGGAGGGTFGDTETQDGDASTTIFTIAHGLGVNPNAVSVEASSIDALGDYQVDHDDTNITITYQSAPPSGTGNLVWIWIASVGGAGEANTYSNAGAGGVGIVLTKTGVDLPFKSINTADSNNITVTNDAGNSEIDIDIGSAVMTASSTHTMTNKTFNADGTGNSITNIENADIKASAGIVYSKLTLTDSIVNADINSAAAIDTSKLADNATILLTTNTKTVTNKSLNISDNTVTATSRATGDLVKDNGTKYERFAMGTAGQVLTVNSGGTDLTWSSLTATAKNTATKSGDGTTKAFTIAHGMSTTPVVAFVEPTSVDALGNFTRSVDATNITITYQIAPPAGTDNLTYFWSAMDSNGGSIAGESVFDDSVRKKGDYVPIGTSVSGDGLLTGLDGYGTITNVTSTNGIFHQFATGTVSGTAAGVVYLTQITRRAFNPYLLTRFAFGGRSSGDCVLYIGLSTRSTLLTNSNTPLATSEAGVFMGFRSGDANFSIFHNDGSGGAFTTVASSEAVPSTSSGIYYFTLQMNSSNIVWSIYNGSKALLDTGTLSSNIPATTDNLKLQALLLNTTTTDKTMTIGKMAMRADY